MRITKSWLRERKIRMQEFAKSILKLDHRQLKIAVKNTIPNAVIHIDGCSNCGTSTDDFGSFTCKCTPSERAMANSDQSVSECLKVLLLDEIERQFPSHVVD